MATEMFSSISENIARRFLQTIVVVDDEAFINTSASADQPEAALVAPSPRGEPDAPVEQMAEVQIAPDSKRPATHLRQLDAKLLIDSFALQGLVCAILAPGQGEQLENHVQALSENADVIVLDWTIHKDGGATAIRIVSDIMERDRRKGGRIRLIVVYTGEPDVNTCYTVLRGRIATLQPVKDTEFALQYGTTRVVFCRKKHDGTAAGIEAYKETELPGKVVREFTNFAGGVLPNTVMSSVAAIRERTHSIVGRFSSNLDGSYLAHRVLLPEAEDANAFLIDLIGDEIKSILESSLEEHAEESAAALDSFVSIRCEKDEYRTIVESPPGKALKLKTVPLDEVRAVVSKGLVAVPNSWGSKDKLFRKIHPLFHENPTEGKERSQRFACLSALRRDHTTIRPENSRKPVLDLGTLIVMNKDDKQIFLVCLQPVCECVRLDAKNSHPFIFGSLVEDETGFDIVIPDTQKRYTSLRFDDRASRSVVLSFAGAASGRIESSPLNDGYGFTATNRSQWLWIGELRHKHAQRLVQRLASQLSRVGLDEFEWQRRYAEM